jgi:hypothetical protein
MKLLFRRFSIAKNLADRPAPQTKLMRRGRDGLNSSAMV